MFGVIARTTPTAIPARHHLLRHTLLVCLFGTLTERTESVLRFPPALIFAFRCLGSLFELWVGDDAVWDRFSRWNVINEERWIYSGVFSKEWC